MQMYVNKHEITGEWTVVTRPEWFYDDKTPVTDETLAEAGYYPLIDECPVEIGCVTHGCVAKEKSLWRFADNKVYITYDVWELSLEEVKAKVLDRINASFESVVDIVVRDYPASEQATWPIQQKEVELWRADPNADTPFLSTLARARGVDLDTLRQAAARKVDNYMLAVAHTVGERQRFSDLIDAATTVQEVVHILESSFHSNPIELEPVLWPDM